MLTSGIEIHAISSSTPSITRSLVQKRLKEITEVDSLYTSLHMHVVAPLVAPGKGRSLPLYTILMRLEHGRRLEMLAHMAQVIVYNTSVESHGPSFSPMSINEVIGFFEGFPEYWTLNKKENYLNRDRAFGYVSFTGPGNYKPIDENPDSVNSLFGYEFRFLQAEKDPEFLSYIMDDAKWFLHQFNERGFSEGLPSRFQNYFEKFLKIPLKRTVVGKYSHLPFDSVVNYHSSFKASRALFEAAYYLGSLKPTEGFGFFNVKQSENKFSFSGDFSAKQRTELSHIYKNRSDERGYEIAFLFHNWGRDPLFFDKLDLLRKIRGAQKRARNRLLGRDKTTTIVRDFLTETGIYDIYKNSIRYIE